MPLNKQFSIHTNYDLSIPYIQQKRTAQTEHPQKYELRTIGIHVLYLTIKLQMYSYYTVIEMDEPSDESNTAINHHLPSETS